MTDPERIWQIQHADLSGGDPQVVSRDGLPGLLDQVVFRDPTALIGQAPLTLESLTSLGRDSVARAVNGGPHVYGFILRSRKPPQTKDHSDLLVASPLLQWVREILYDRPSRFVCINHKVEHRFKLWA